MEDFLPLSALQHFAFCPRQFALIHVEQAWAENKFTAEGRILHERVDSGVSEQRKGVRYERGVSLVSEKYCLTGKLDLLEVYSDDPTRFVPVEYKRGKPKLEHWDRIQVCAQALCLEEMRDATISEGAIWYWEVRRREAVHIDSTLREITLDAINQAEHIIRNGITPKPIEDRKRCRACSLVDICQPDRFRSDKSVQYVRTLFDS